MYLLAEIITSPGMFEKNRGDFAGKKTSGDFAGHFLGMKKKSPLEDMEIVWNIGIRRVVEKSCSSQDLSFCRCEKCCFLMARQSLAHNLSFLWRLYWLLAKRK